MIGFFHHISKETHGYCFLLLLVIIPQILVSSPHASAASLPSCCDPVSLTRPLPHSFCTPVLQAPLCFLTRSLPTAPSANLHHAPKEVLPPPPYLHLSVWASAEPKVLSDGDTHCLQSHSMFLGAARHTKDAPMKTFIEAHGQMQKLSNTARFTHHP